MHNPSVYYPIVHDFHTVGTRRLAIETTTAGEQEKKNSQEHGTRTTLGGLWYDYCTPPPCSQDAGFPQFHGGQKPLREASLTLGNISTFATWLWQGFFHCHPPERHIFLCIQNLFHAGLQDFTHIFWGIFLEEQSYQVVLRFLLSLKTKSIQLSLALLVSF